MNVKWIVNGHEVSQPDNVVVSGTAIRPQFTNVCSGVVNIPNGLIQPVQQTVSQSVYDEMVKSWLEVWDENRQLRKELAELKVKLG